jgi:hypothetical protein
MAFKFTPVEAQVIDVFWSQISPLFEKIIEKEGMGRETLASLKEKIKERYLLVWIGWEDSANNIVAAYCTQIIEYPTKRICQWGYMSAKNNEMSRWEEPMLKSLVRYTIENECNGIEFFSTRTGWKKIFKKYKINIEPVGTLYETKTDA